MNELILVTTEGCKACEIQNNIIHKAVELSKDKYNIKVSTLDFTEYTYLEFANKITDFPTTILKVSGKEITKVVGTCTKEHLMHLFDEFFIENK